MASPFTTIIKDIAIFIIAIVLVAVTASYAAAAAAKITDISNWKNNDKLKSAHTKLSWAASIGWIYVGIIVIIIIILIILALTGIVDLGLSDIIEFNLLPTIITIVNVGTVGVLLATGVLSAIGTANIDQAKVNNNEGSKEKALISTIVSIGSLGLVIIFIIVSYFITQQQKKKKTEEIQRQDAQSEALIIKQLSELKQ
jgi:uncharacterized membrane protein YidH (DUF202 family)